MVSFSSFFSLNCLSYFHPFLSPRTKYQTGDIQVTVNEMGHPPEDVKAPETCKHLEFLQGI